MKRTADQIHDEWLVIRCQSGDKDALRELIQRWQVRLKRIVWKLTDGADATPDIVQEVWLSAVKKIRRLNDPACFPQWIYRIASARSVDWIRKQQRERGLRDNVEFTRAGQDSSIEAADQTANTDLKRALEELPGEQKIVLTLYYLDDLPLSAIAAILSIPEGTVKSRLFHARVNLRKIIERSEGDEKS